MKIWFNSNDIVYNKFCSEQLIITPFLDSAYIKTNPSFDDIDNYKSKIAQDVHLAPLQNCDYIVYPNKLAPTATLMDYIKLSEQYKKPLLTFYVDDDSTPSKHIENMIVYRTSMFKSKMKDHERALPAWSKDFKTCKEVPVRPKNEIPTVGFCGYINHPETKIRRECINRIQSYKNITKNIIIRSSFWGGNIDGIEVRNEYIDNMINSDFILCTRGSGNFSYRLYETLSAGRIPIFIDSDSCLPFDSDILYDTFFPIIKESELDNMEQIILDFWKNIKDYNKLQEQLYELYKTWFSPYGFINKLSKELI